MLHQQISSKPKPTYLLREFSLPTLWTCWLMLHQRSSLKLKPTYVLQWLSSRLQRLGLKKISLLRTSGRSTCFIN